MGLLGWDQHFKIAKLDDVPWPTSMGGNTVCPIGDRLGEHHNRYHRPPLEFDVSQWVDTLADVPRCWHHHWGKERLLFMARIACWFVKNDLHVTLESSRAICVAAGERDEDVSNEIAGWFFAPIRWSFVPGEQVANGRHRICALKWANVKRFPIATTAQRS